MTINVSNINSYNYTSGNYQLALVSSNAPADKAGVIVNNQQSTNSALLFEYSQNLAKTNIAQQFVLDNNLKETLAFLNSEAAKKTINNSRKKYHFIIDSIINESDVFNFEASEEEQNLDDLSKYNIEIDESVKNIFAA